MTATAETARETRWATDAEVLALIRQDCERRDIPWDGRSFRRANSLVLAYATLRRSGAVRRAQTVSTTYLKLGQAMYGRDVVYDRETKKRKTSSLQRWFRELHRLGLIELTEVGGRNGGLSITVLGPRVGSSRFAPVAQLDRAADF